jgi:methyl-accepting chemotaxis protein-1 (serine sensor receptor)
MQDVVKAVQGVTQIMEDIRSASLEQTKGIEQINQAVTHMDQITQDDAAMAEQVMQITTALDHQSQQVMTAISAFGGRKVAAASPKAVASAQAMSSRGAHADHESGHHGAKASGF